LKTDHSTFNNSDFSTGASLLKRALWFVCGAIFVNSYAPMPMNLKLMLLRLFGAKIGAQVVIKPKVNIKYPWLLEIGDHAWIGEKVWIDNLVQVSIGSHACISQGALLLTGNHNYKKSSFDLITGQIFIDDGAWVGAKAVICPGVRVSSHSIVTVGSVLTKSSSAYGIYQGNPAIKIKERQISA
tara:strand:- start:150576 stop:151127 length:552 start_codon:yes stop_codon:yes gene_type:complete